MAVLLTSGAFPAAAQDATPSSGGRGHLVTRQYRLSPGYTMEELAGLVERGYLPILKQVPGFREYILAETDDGVLAILLFADRTGAERTSQLAADWVRQNLTGFFDGPPTETIAAVWIQDLGGDAANPAP